MKTNVGVNIGLKKIEEQGKDFEYFKKLADDYNKKQEDLTNGK